LPQQILEQYWGYSTFRDKQKEIIQSILQGQDTFALLPTGGGKSICYQVPALMVEGVCVVVSPLIALMRDQVQQLTNRNISATYLYGGLSKKELAIEYENIRNNKYTLVYVSPERLQSKAFLQNLKRTNVSFLAVDEAHCISQWGHDFRPEYRQISTIKELLPGLTTLALTASATEQVVEDIVERLALTSPVIIRKSFHRPNLSYQVRYDENKRGRVLGLFQHNEDSGIIYVRTRRKTVELAKLLQEHGVKADYYHGGLNTKDRNIKQDQWSKGTTKVIVSTNAFGMGIDKPDVRIVVHYDMPDSLEAYYQEAGRAGRDGNFAQCILLYDEADILQLRNFVMSQFPSLVGVQNIYDSLCNYFELAYNSGLEARFDFNLLSFCEKFEFKAIDVFSAIKALQKLGYIHLSEGIHRPSKIKVEVSSTQLYDLQLRSPKYDNLIKTVLRSYSGVYDFYTVVSEHQIAQRSKNSIPEVVNKLKQLNELKIISYQQASDLPFVTFLRPRVKEIVDIEDVLVISKDRTVGRMEGIIAYVEGETCRSVQICAYFGEDNLSQCGICDICSLSKKMKTDHAVFNKVEEMVMKSSKSRQTVRDLITANSQDMDGDAIAEVLQWLIEDKKVIINKSGYLRLRK
jgi:ATP-dependent DNA helicase RecQ